MIDLAIVLALGIATGMAVVFVLDARKQLKYAAEESTRTTEEQAKLQHELQMVRSDLNDHSNRILDYDRDIEALTKHTGVARYKRGGRLK